MSVNQSFEILPKHIGLATNSQSFTLNLKTSIPLTNK